MKVGLKRSPAFATMAMKAAPTTTRAKIGLPPRNARGSSPLFMVSNMRQSSENVMMENMSLPTSRGTRLPALKPVGCAVIASAGSATALWGALSREESGSLLPTSSRQGCPVRSAWKTSRPKDRSGTTMNPMKLVWLDERAATLAVTMAAAGEAKAAKWTEWCEKRSPQSTCNGPAPMPPATKPHIMSSSLLARIAKGMRMPLASSAKGVIRKSIQRMRAIELPPARQIRATTAAHSAPLAR